ncbi:tumor necrosis factor receptor superfamily member 1A [Hypomesus transpacificus]|uniref:tumor necrosis factor receptor superfamily member 1A n=1 Tax=Hypomesus transpacificus TaxID=137520 RepID=UPI001F07B0D3|nr:tumor necrosis factor receptor superfamily member 1A [Hypomesus transpacificus]XP_046898192.1 tumor necrosis factor receptor superfamily member 1A [Hypomesus transpacificus]
MEAAVLRGKCKKKLPVYILLLLCVLAPALSAPATSNLDECLIGEYISEDGVCCGKCHPGFRLVKDCPERDKTTSCKQCRNGTFMDKSNTARNCIRCRDCRASNFEEEASPCSIYKNRECRCVNGYYRNHIDSLTHECLECKNCRSPRCQFLCGPDSPPEELETLKPPENVDVVLPVVVACFVALLGVISLVTYLATKKSVKRKIRLRIDGSASFSEPTSQESQKSTKKLITDSECPEKQNLAVPTQCESDLPDCVPKEIKIQKVIYSVLDLVSVRHVKQLVRSLGVSERDIERAEVDYRSVQEANYQMLKLWAEGGARGGARGGAGPGVLPRALLQDLLENLRGMDLGGVAEELEEKFRVQ